MRDLRARKRTFRDCVLDLGALHNDVVIVEALLLLDQIVGVSSVLVAVVRRRALRRELDAADEEPLDEREGDSDDGCEGDEDLRQEIGEDSRSHGGSGRRNGGEGRISVGNGSRETKKKQRTERKRQTPWVLGDLDFSTAILRSLAASSSAYIGSRRERARRKESRIL